MKALIFENKVVGLTEVEHPVHVSLKWVDAPKNCKRGWILEDEVLVAPPSPPELTYAQKRASEYPSIQDQLDEIYHNGIDSWKAVIKVTKDKYPKG